MGCRGKMCPHGQPNGCQVRDQVGHSPELLKQSAVQLPQETGMMVTIDQSVYSTSTLSKDLLLNIWIFALFCVGPGGHNGGHPGEGGGGWEGGGE